jgi:hypothetical protein
VAVLCFPLAASAQGNFQGKLWVVDIAQASDVTFPAPTRPFPLAALPTSVSK